MDQALHWFCNVDNLMKSVSQHYKGGILILTLTLQMGKRRLERSSSLSENLQMKVVEWRFEPRHSYSRTHRYCRRGGVFGETGSPPPLHISSHLPSVLSLNGK